MICPVRAHQHMLFQQACGCEHVFGSRALASYRLYGLNDCRHSFFLSMDAFGKPDAALHLNEKVLSIITSGGPAVDELAAFVRAHGVLEIDTTYQQALALQKILGGEIESSYFMEYPAKRAPQLPDAKIIPTQDARAVYNVLCQSHEYYRDHLQYAPWAQDLEKRWKANEAVTVLLMQNGQEVATGSIISADAQAAALAAVAVLPECRGKGLGSAISAWLTAQVLSWGKRPVLISGYDEVAQLYRNLGYRETGRWGELYL